MSLCGLSRCPDDSCLIGSTDAHPVTQIEDSRQQLRVTGSHALGVPLRESFTCMG
jgi:hypothetical protein